MKKIIKTLGLDLNKPEKITDEEIKFYKEQTICLVCKTTLKRKNVYLCPGCKVLYCLNCSDALSKLENACWVCNIPFDESKPIEIYETEEEFKILEHYDSKKKK